MVGAARLYDRGVVVAFIIEVCLLGMATVIRERIDLKRTAIEPGAVGLTQRFIEC